MTGPTETKAKQMRDNPIAVDGLTASVRTWIQTQLITLVTHGVHDQWWLTTLVPFGTAAAAVIMHVLSERYPKLAKVFNAALSDGAARYIGK